MKPLLLFLAVMLVVGEAGALEGDLVIDGGGQSWLSISLDNGDLTLRDGCGKTVMFIEAEGTKIAFPKGQPAVHETLRRQLRKHRMLRSFVGLGMQPGLASSIVYYINQDCSKK